MARDFFSDVVTYTDAEGDAHPLSNVSIQVTKIVGVDEDVDTQIYTTRTGGTAATNPFPTLPGGDISFWAATGQYKITMTDLEFPARFGPKTVYWNAIAHPDFESIVPVGTIVGTGRSTAPPGWMFCNGAAVSRISFDDLFAAIGTQFGAGDGSSTFTLPDMRGRVAVGSGSHVDVGLGDSDAVAEADRTPNHAHGIPHAHSISHTHTISHVHSMAHNHDLSNHAHGVVDHVHGIGSDGNHGHTFAGGVTLLSNSRGASPGTLQTLYAPGKTEQAIAVDVGGAHSHGGATGGASALATGGPNVNATGASSAANTGSPSNSSSGGASVADTGSFGGISQVGSPPYQTINYMIKF